MVSRIRTLRIQLTPSNSCNLNCFYCCKEGTETKFSILRDENIVRLITASKDCLQIKRVKYTGGEPLSYKSSLLSREKTLPTLMKTVDELGISQSVVTNGTDVNVLRELVKKSPSFDCCISLPALDYEVYKKIAGHETKNEFNNTKKSIDFFIEKKLPLKINYVLVNTINSDSDSIGKVIEQYAKNPVSVRFLQLAKNNVNEIEDKFITTCESFSDILKSLGFSVVSESRSHNIYRNQNGTEIKLIKFFCSDICGHCPEDKTSLWVTPEGIIKDCCFGNTTEVAIKDWTYSGLTALLSDNFGNA